MQTFIERPGTTKSRAKEVYKGTKEGVTDGLLLVMTRFFKRGCPRCFKNDKALVIDEREARNYIITNRNQNVMIAKNFSTCDKLFNIIPTKASRIHFYVAYPARERRLDVVSTVATFTILCRGTRPSATA